MEFELDDQIRLMAAMVAAGLLIARGGEADGIARDAVEIASAIHEIVAKSAWSFKHGQSAIRGKEGEP